jgi:hypothetical protein
MSEVLAHADASTPAGAQARLASLTGDPAWGARLTSGDQAARLEFDLLTKASIGFGSPSQTTDVTKTALDAFTKAAAAGEHPVLQMKAMREASGGTPPTAEEMIAVSDRAKHAVMAEEVIAAAKEKFELSPAIEAEIRNGSRATPEQYEAVARMRNQRMNDPEWGKRVLANEPLAQREMFLMSLVLSNPPEGA